jgi:hypothetical protein
MGKSTISMAIFHSYVKLLEGILLILIGYIAGWWFGQCLRSLVVTPILA